MYLLVFMRVLLLLLLLLLPLLFLLPNCAYDLPVSSSTRTVLWPSHKNLSVRSTRKNLPVSSLPENLPVSSSRKLRVQGLRSLKTCHAGPQIELRKIRKLKRIVTGTTDVLVHAVRYQNWCETLRFVVEKFWRSEQTCDHRK